MIVTAEVVEDAEKAVNIISYARFKTLCSLLAPG